MAVPTGHLGSPLRRAALLGAQGRLKSPAAARRAAHAAGGGEAHSDAAFGHAGLPGGLHNPQFHAWWHGIMGVHSYLGPTFMVYQRLVYLGRKPRLCYLLGVLPYVVPGPA